ncbi:MAG TPA: PIG-L family deacetylase [Pyrinomonadaceae bacterium]|nr:PIG-L family deacetylase [Pyrinomonadaceae bacterium]
MASIGLRRNALAIALLFVLLSSSELSLLKAGAQGDSNDGAGRAELHQALLDLTNPWTVMCVAAHPDDEDGSTLTILRRKYGVHTVSLFSTFGEGGQNAVGPELYEELGVIRAKETIAAAKVQGSEPHFLGLRDFGFSKSAEEAFRAWGEKEALRRMVLQIRLLRPDVIITNHDTVSGHGHHQATGRLILQAFDAAADPKQFPEQLSEVAVWQPQRLFVRGFRGPQTATSTTDSNNQEVTIDPNETDPIRGTTYAQQALTALQQHATQGPWPKSIGPNGGRIIRYNLVRKAANAAPLPANAKTPLDGLRLPEPETARLVAPTIEGKPLTDFLDKRSVVLASLVNARKLGAFTATKEITGSDAQRFQLMAGRLDAALATAANVALTVTSADRVLVPDHKTPFDVTLTNSGEEEVFIKGWKSQGLSVEKKLETAEKLLPGTETSQQLMALTPRSAKFSVPSAEHLYDGRLFGDPFEVDTDVEVDGAQFSLSAKKYMDVAPPVEITNNNPTPCVETPATVLACESTSLTLTNNLDSQFQGVLELTDAKARHAPMKTQPLSLKPHESLKVVNGPIKPVPSRGLLSFKHDGPITVKVLDGTSKQSISELTIPNIYIPAIAVAGIRVGFVPSTDPTLKNSLTALGVEKEELTGDSIAKADLSRFDTIIIDNRGYEIHPELIKSNDRLLKFVEDGGTLLVFYHKTTEWNPDERRSRPQLAPYPIILDDQRVTEEDAPVRFLQPRHRLLTFPNPITQKDFDNWVQERGLYFPKEWDPRYAALLSTNDKGEKPLTGGLLVADYGKGHYIFTSFVWYRQLRAAIPGGYRVFANMISYGKRSNTNQK